MTDSISSTGAGYISRTTVLPVFGADFSYRLAFKVTANPSSGDVDVINHMIRPAHDANTHYLGAFGSGIFGSRGLYIAFKNSGGGNINTFVIDTNTVLNEWLVCGYTRNGTTGDTHFYVARKSAPTSYLVSHAIGVTSLPGNNNPEHALLRAIDDAISNPRCRVAGYAAYAAELSEAEIQAEWLARAPTHSSPYIYLPLSVITGTGQADAGLDSSGNGRDYAVTTTLAANVDDPWAVSVDFPPRKPWNVSFFHTFSYESVKRAYLNAALMPSIPVDQPLLRIKRTIAQHDVLERLPRLRLRSPESVDNPVFLLWSGFEDDSRISKERVQSARRYPILSALNTYSLSLVRGLYSVSGQSSNQLRGLKTTATQGSYTLSGQTLLLNHGYKTALVQGSYILTGQSLSTLHSYRSALTQGTYSLSGQSISVVGGLSASLIRGNYSLSGQVLSGIRTLRLTQSNGFYSITGQSILTRRDLRTILNQGSYSLTGQTLSVQSAGTVQLTKGSYSLLGQVLSPKAARSVGLTNGTLIVTGQSVTPKHNIVASLANGTYSLTGQAIQFGNSFALVVTRGNYNLNGRSVALVIVQNSIPTGTVLEAIWLPSEAPEAKWSI
jgi:hypothetical protein